MVTKNGILIIPNVRWNDERTYEFCFCGINKYSTVAISTYGCIKNKIDREYFEKGLQQLVKKLLPKNIVVYGSAPDDIFGEYKSTINIISFESEFSKSRKQVLA